jgi:transcriptional regulator with GAF, ATPase, and Fis domain/Tfp pilus assembly protein PilF/predicted Ser/Thr protein kinase
MLVARRYQVVKSLGQGSGGEVLLVEDAFSPGRPLVLKTLRGDDAQLVGALRREFQVLAALRHPRIAQVYDFGKIPQGEPGGPATFMTREFLEGRSLHEAFEGDSIDSFVSLAVGVCRALEPLHQAGLVHGDLKPDNVIVGPTGTVRLIDFGLVRNEGESAGWPAGTVPYIAPEVLEGSAADPRSDLYSLGVVLYELIAGAPPFVGTPAEVIRGHLNGAVPQLRPRRGFLEKDPTSLQQISRLIMRLLAKRPTERLPRASEVEAALIGLAPGAVVGEDDTITVLAGLLGCDPALSVLEEAMERRHRLPDSACPVIAVRGGPGSGKSTLLRELKWRAQLGQVQVVEAACESSPPAALWPLPELVRRLELLAGPSPERGGEQVIDLPERLVDAALRAVQQGPLLVIVEDLHAASSETCAALRSFAYGVGESSLILVVSYIQGSDSEGMDLQLGEHPAVDLPPLGRPEVERLTQSILGRSDERLAAQVLDWTGGNPLFCVETLRAIRGQGGVSAAGLEQLGVPRRLEEFWWARARDASGAGLRLLAAAAILGRPVPPELLAEVGGLEAAAIPALLEALFARGLLRRHPTGDIGLAHAGLSDGVRSDLSIAELEAMHHRAASALATRGASPSERAHHLLRAGPSVRDEGRALAVDAARDLLRSGASREAARVLEAAIAGWSGTGGIEARLLAAEANHAAGDYQVAARILEELNSSVESQEDRVAVLSMLGRVRAARGEYDAATSAWSEALDLMPAAGGRARLRRDLGRMLLKRGDFSNAESVTTLALADVDDSDPLRADLLCTLGLVADYRGDPQRALSQYQEALRIARSCGARREEAMVLTYEAITHQRVGDLERARDAYSRSLRIAEEVGDVASTAVLHGNLGALTYSAGEPVRALEHYRSALRLARRVGRETTAVTARANLGLLHLYFGELERARYELEGALKTAERLGMRQVTAQVMAHLGELALRLGELDRAVDLYREARARYESVGQRRETVEVALELVGVQIARSTASDLRDAKRDLEDVRKVVLGESLETLVPLLELTEGRLAQARGEEEQALTRFERAARDAQRLGNTEVEWQAEGDAGGLLLRRGAPLAARGKLQRAAEVLERVAATLPRELRKSFWHDQRRRNVRRTMDQASVGDDGISNTRERDQTTTDALFRLLEINKRINSDHDLSTLFTRIMDSAVELTDAERGFLLLVNERGELEITTARDFDQGTPDDAHLQFSRSIAESVLIDGEPVVTVNAMDDRRFNEFLSVHKLRLQSVLCIPIRSRGHAIGVLYMENRVRRGGFSEPDQRLLLAFADQVAIALETSRLMAELTHRSQELERAKQEIERLCEERGKQLNQRTAQLAAARRDLRQAMDQIHGRVGYRGVVGQSAPMLRVFAVLDRVRQTDVPVVIAGESGTGKEMIARAVHSGGPRAKKPFVAINCGAIPETLLESELFGHMRGSFTGADRDKKGLLLSANGGTVFLDEIGDMPLKMQLDLLRVLQERKVRPVGSEKDVEIDVRILAASNRPLRELIRRGTFREDLYYRLSVVEIGLPPLRDRIEDVPLLVDHFLNQIAARFKAAKKSVSRDAMRQLMSYPWPGNVRQVEHALMNAWVMCDSETIGWQDFTLEPLVAPHSVEVTQFAPLPATARDHHEMEKQRILEALEQTGWNRSKTASVLGMPRRTLYRRLRTYGIQ